MKEKIILLTYDYELFLKKSGTPEKCIINPTQNLLEIFNKTNIKATFFVDILYYSKLIENNETREKAGIIENQLQELVKQGHRIELHLHPNWIDSYYKNGQWFFTHYDNYRMDYLSDEMVNDIFKKGMEAINNIARKIKPEYKVISYRSGGLCIEPFTKIKNALKVNDIYIDSSIAFGTYNFDPIHKYDFRYSPDTTFYKFSDSTNIIDEAGDFYEIPITTFKLNIFDKLRNKIYSKTNPDFFKIFGDGEGIPSYHKRNIFDKISSSFSMFTLEGTHPDILHEKIKKSDKQIITLITHPKLMSKSSFLCIEKLYTKGYKFYNIQDFFNEFILKNNKGL